MIDQHLDTSAGKERREIVQQKDILENAAGKHDRADPPCLAEAFHSAGDTVREAQLKGAGHLAPIAPAEAVGDQGE
jgi:hypothetical protein